MMANSEPFTNFAQELLAAVERLAESIKDPNDPRLAALTAIAKDLKMGTSPSSMHVPASQEAALAEALERNGVPFVVIDSVEGGKLFIVRRKHEEALRRTAAAVLTGSADYFREVSPEKIVASCAAAGYATTPVITISEEGAEHMESIKNQLAENNTVFAEFSDEAEPGAAKSMIVHAQSLFSSDGKDLCTAEFMISAVVSRPPSVAAAYRKATEYDAAIKEKFLKSKKEDGTVLCSEKGGPALKWNNGVIEYYESSSGGVPTGKVAQTFDTRTGADPEGFVDKHAASIRDAVLKDGKGEPVAIKINGTEYTTRPDVEGDARLAFFKDVKSDVEAKIKAAGADASAKVHIAYPGASPEKLYRAKRKEMEKNLGPVLEAYQQNEILGLKGDSQQLEDFAAKYEITEDEAKELLDEMAAYVGSVVNNFGTPGRDAGAAFDVDVERSTRGLIKQLGKKLMQRAKVDLTRDFDSLEER